VLDRRSFLTSARGGGLHTKHASNANVVREALLDANCPAVIALRRAIAQIKQRRSVIEWVTKIYYLELFRASKGTLIPAAFAVVSTHQPALGPRGGLWPFRLMCNP
jgi:hypothetical protein